MENKNYFINRIIIVIGIVIGIISLYLLLTYKTSNKPIAGQGNLINGDVKIGGHFELVNQNGDKFESDSLHGKLSLIYFGFTYCPDVCPASLQKITKVLEILDKYHIDINAVFITIDPERDTSSLLKEYIKYFHSKLIALTGSKEEIKKVADNYKVYYAKAYNNENASEYMMDHSTFIYLLDKQGKYLKHFYVNSIPEEIAESIRINYN